MDYTGKKVDIVDPNAYDWEQSLGMNLGREFVSQGDRLTVYHEFQTEALQGKKPRIVTPLLVIPPANGEDDDVIPAIAKGYGRVKSVLKWNEQTPLERLKAALLNFRATGLKNVENKRSVSRETIESITSIDEVVGLVDISVKKMGVDPAAIVAAFKEEVSLPIIWFEGSVDQARYEAIRDNVSQQKTTVADNLMIYGEEIDKPGVNNAMVADLLGVEPARVSKYKKWDMAVKHGRVHPLFKDFVFLHCGMVDLGHKKKCSFDRVMGFLQVGNDDAYHANNTKSLDIEFDKTDQEEILLKALLNSWPTESSAVCPSVVNDVQVGDLKRIQIDGFTDAVKWWRVERQARKDKAEGKKPAEVQVAPEVDTSVPNADTKARPSLTNVYRFLDAKRWKNHRKAPFVKAIAAYVLGHATANEAAELLAGTKAGKSSMAVPTFPLDDKGNIKPLPKPEPADQK